MSIYVAPKVEKLYAKHEKLLEWSSRMINNGHQLTVLLKFCVEGKETFFARKFKHI